MSKSTRHSSIDGRVFETAGGAAIVADALRRPYGTARRWAVTRVAAEARPKIAELAWRNGEEADILAEFLGVSADFIAQPPRKDAASTACPEGAQP